MRKKDLQYKDPMAKIRIEVIMLSISIFMFFFLDTGCWSQDFAGEGLTILESRLAKAEFNPNQLDMGNLPNLVLYNPPGWTDKIMIFETSSMAECDNQIMSTDSLHAELAIANLGAECESSFEVGFYIDGIMKDIITINGLSSDYYISVITDSIGHLSHGTHTISIVIDPHLYIDESDESDNVNTKTIMVSSTDSHGCDFKAVPTSGKAPLTVKFTDLSDDKPINWLWKFGDGKTSRAKDPIHIYNKKGKYTVSLTINGSDGRKTTVKRKYINVSGLVENKFSGTYKSSTMHATFPGSSYYWTCYVKSLTLYDDLTWKASVTDTQSCSSTTEQHHYTSSGTYKIKGNSIKGTGYNSRWGEAGFNLTRDGVNLEGGSWIGWIGTYTEGVYFYRQ